MTQGPASPHEVRRQIWESLVSMLRVYTSAASLNSEDYAITTGTGMVRVTHAECVLLVTYSPQADAGHWQLQNAHENKSIHDSNNRDSSEASGGTFQIDDGGCVNFPGGSKELDEAAIHWVGQLRHEGCAA